MSSGKAQHSFSGQINAEEWQNSVYLSIVEDYRKISGVYSEQIIARTIADSSGYFEFKGNLLDDENRIYRIHVDNCSEEDQESNHFNGHCADSKYITFIAKNTDTIALPFGFDQQIFCAIESNNPKAMAFIEVDSLKGDMRFAYSEVRSEANRKLNNKKWFKILQDYGKSLDEPLAELYVYAFLSDRSSDFHEYYLEDLKTNDYYTDLKARLETSYPDSPYTDQYTKELNADRYMLSEAKSSEGFSSGIILMILLILSILLNLFFLYKYFQRRKHRTRNLKALLSKQEQIVLEHILQDKSNKDIAEALFLSVSTVKTH
ncbi:MAG: LuxR C-terminal-related transcriptional regulator, partial [Bacteroidota bacterium]